MISHVNIYECPCGRTVDVAEDAYDQCSLCEKITCHNCGVNNDGECNECHIKECLKITSKESKQSLIIGINQADELNELVGFE